jgi:hypothetical protein
MARRGAPVARVMARCRALAVNMDGRSKPHARQARHRDIAAAYATSRRHARHCNGIATPSPPYRSGIRRAEQDRRRPSALPLPPWSGARSSTGRTTAHENAMETDMHDPADAALRILMYFIMPLWIAAGTADYLCHRRTHIARTAGPKESVLHLLMFTEIGIPLLACLFLEINALVFLVMIVAFVAHEATALWDVSYATSRRHVGPFEQHVHSFLELLPLAAGMLVAVRHWPQFLALFGLGQEPAGWDLRLKEQALPAAYVTFVLLAALLLEILPYVEELLRGLKARRTGMSPRSSPWPREPG